MKILVATDAWHPQVNGVVQTLLMMSRATKALGVEMEFLTPQSFRTVAMPGYPGIRLAMPRPARIAQLIEASKPDAIHIATEGPIGMLVRRYCRTRSLDVSSSFHTRFPEYVSARLPVPEAWVWAMLRRFHSLSSSVMAATAPLARELSERGFDNVRVWPRGVDADLFRPRTIDLGFPRPVFLSVGRVAVEKISRRSSISLCLEPRSWSVTARNARAWSVATAMRCFSANSSASNWRRRTRRPTCSCSRAGPIRSDWYCWRHLRAVCQSRRFRSRDRATSSATRRLAP